TIHVTNDIFIPDNVTLTVLPGTYIEFQGHFRIKVFGVLLAEGLPADSITFTINDTTGFHDIDTVTGGWNGIQFNNALAEGANGAMNNNDSSIISYCILEYGKSVNVNLYPDNAGGAIMDENFDKLRISHCHLRNNYGTYGGAIYADDCDIFIYANKVENNSAYYGGGVYTYNGDPSVVNNVIVNNQAVQGGGISCWANATTHVRNNIITNNKASNTGGGVWINNSSPDIVNNLIVNNTSDYKGGGVSIDNSKPTLVNNTVGNNSSVIGGGVYLTADSDPVIMNNIVWENQASDTGSQVFIQDENSQPVFNYCIVQDSITNFGFGSGVSFNGEFINSSESDPRFTLPSAGSGTDFNGLAADWSVQLGSVAINGGNPDTTGLSLPIFDLAGNKRLANRRVDIGSYEFQFSLMEWCGDVSSDTNWIADTVRVTCSFSIQDDVTLTINPGTFVEFTDNSIVFVHGTIRA
ncbi:hypothetical protein LCGC14_2599870, partial [marine sediment metagenome]